jgi:hypothetical protein
MSVSGNSNVVVVTGTGMTLGSASGGNLTGANVISANTLVVGAGSGGNITGASIITSNSYTANGAVTGNANVSAVTANLGIRTVFSTYTDNSAAASATIANAAIHAFAAPNLAASNTSVTFTNAATMYIEGGPVANTNATITNSYSLMVGGNARFTGNITGTLANGNSNVYIATANGNVTIAAVGNTTMTITGTGVNVAGTVNASGNIAAAFFIGNGSQLTGISGGGGASISNGNSNVNIATANGNITFNSAGNANIMTITGTGANITGTANITGNVALSGANVTLGNVSNVRITGGSSQQVLTTDGSGTLSWVSPTTSSITVNSFTGNGVQTQFNLSVTPVSVNYVFLAIGGVSQPRSTYSLVGSLVTISSAPANGVTVEFTSITGTGGTPVIGNTSSSAIFLLPNTLSSNTTFSTSVNGFSVGPITVQSGVTVTVPAGQRWVII